MRIFKKLNCIFFGFVLLASTLSAQSNLEIEGAGFFQNRALKSRLAFLQSLEPSKPADLDAALLEDSAFLLLEQLKREGYLEPLVHAVLIEKCGQRTVTWSSSYSIQLDADTVPEAVTFKVELVVMAYYANVSATGVTAIDPDKLKRFFIPGGVLVETRKSKVFTPENLDRRIGRVLSTLDVQGYRDAQLVDKEVKLDSVTGAAEVSLQFEQGPLYYVKKVVLTTQRGDEASTASVDVNPETVLTPDWEQLQRIEYRNEAFRAGYPDAKVTLTREPHPAEEESGQEENFVNVSIEADWGAEVLYGGVRFEGDEATKRTLLSRQLDLEPGAPLDLIEASEARRKLVGLGIYKKVDMTFEPATGATREVVYTLEPGQRKELKLLTGWGSYELLRAGLQWDHKNPFGRAHRYQIEAKQSFKSSSVSATYSIPQIFGSDLLLYADVEHTFLSIILVF